jgi:hypothetical protein
MFNYNTFYHPKTDKIYLMKTSATFNFSNEVNPC